MENRNIQYLRRTKRGIPQEIKFGYPYNNTIRVATHYVEPSIEEKRAGYNKGNGSVLVFLVPKNGTGDKRLVYHEEIKEIYRHNLTKRSREIANDNSILINILKGFLGEQLIKQLNENRDILDRMMEF